MNTLYIPKTPRINWKEPLARGLIFALPLTENGGFKNNGTNKYLQDLVQNIQCISTQTLPTWRKTLVGNALEFSGASAASGQPIQIPRANINYSGQFALTFFYQPLNTPGGNVAFFDDMWGNNSAGGFQCYHSGGNGALSLHAGDLTGDDTVNTVTNVTVANFPNGCWITLTGSKAVGKIVAYINGKYDQSITATKTYTNGTGNTPYFWMGTNNGNTSNDFCRMANVMIHNRYLQAQEVAELHRDPFRVYRAPMIILPAAFLPSGTSFTQTLTDSITPSETFSKQTNKLLTDTDIVNDIGRTNFINNPSFENNVTDDVQMENLGTGTAALTRDTTTSQFGSASAKVSINANPTQTEEWRIKFDMMVGLFNFKAGVNYAISCYIKTSDSRNIKFGIEDGTITGQYGLSVPTTTSWQQYEFDFTVPADGTGRPKLFLNLGGAVGTINIDGCQMEIAATATSYIDGDQKRCWWLGTAHNSNSAAGNISIGQFRSFSDSISLVDSIAKQAQKFFTETALTLTEVFSKVYTPGGHSFTQTLTDSITPSETFTKLTSKPASDSVSLSEVFSKQANKSLIETALSFTESFTKNPRKALSDSVTPSETFTHIATLFRTLTDSVTVSEVFTKLTSKPKTESVTPTDTITMVKGKTFTETISLVETFLKNPQKVVSDTVIPSEIFSHIATLKRTLLDSITPSEIFSKLISKPLSDSNTGVSEIFTKQTTKVVKDTVTPSEVFTHIATLLRTLTDSVTPSEVFSKLIGKKTNDTVSPSDTMSRATTKVKTDSVVPAEVFNRFTQKFFTEISLTLTENFSNNKNKQVNVTDTVSPTDIMTKSTTKVVSDTVGETESFSTLTSRFKLFSDSVTPTDSMTTVKTLVRSFVDGISLFETFSKKTTKVFTTDSITLVETFTTHYFFSHWANISKASATWIKQVKSSDTWVKVTKTVTNWTKVSKPE